ncbi:MAG: sodium-translocating pyrophosphatase [Candidatus Aenigmatarchaeota archaeon]
MELLFVLAIAGLSLLFALAFSLYILKKEEGTPSMTSVANGIKEGAMAYLAREYKNIFIFAVIITAILALFINVPTAITFFFGCLFSALAGFLGMSLSVRTNVRVAQAARKGLDPALNIAIKGGAVTGFAVAGLALLGVTAFYMIYKNPLLIVGFGFGASLVSLFARIGGGIYTKSADIGADLVGKVEKGIPEDDPRNPAVIADQVGDNVGDCAGMGADLFETYAVTAIGAMLLGALAIGEQGVAYPLLIGAAAIIASFIGLFFMRGKSIMRAMYAGLIATVIIAGALFYFFLPFYLWLCSILGIVIGLLLFCITEYFTSEKFGPVKSIAESSQTGPATNILTGLAIGMKSVWPPVLVIAAGIILAYWLGGVYGIGIAVMAMLSLTATIITLDSYGPITDNASGIAEMAGLEKKVRAVTEKLDAVGNTTKAVTKTFAIGSAALAALTLFAAYVQEINIAQRLHGISEAVVFELGDPLVLIGLLIGGLIPFIFSSLCLNAVGKGAFKVVEEVRRQFSLGILKGKAKPDYAKAVDIVTATSLRAMSAPALLAVISPLLVGFILGPKALGGFLLGSIITGFMLAVQMSMGGASWDNAKKYIEGGKFGGKGSDAHKAAVVGDTVGDPYKDTAGPAINPLIKVMNTIAIIFTSLIVIWSLL